MKFVQSILASGVALAALAASAQADDLANFKAQLNSLYSTPAYVRPTSDVPPQGDAQIYYPQNGYQQVGYQQQAVVQQDNSGASTIMTWGGLALAAVWAQNFNTLSGSNNTVDIVTAMHLQANGYTQTALGEMGAHIEIQGVYSTFFNGFANTQGSIAGGPAGAGIFNAGNTVLQTDDFHGWWKMTPNFTLSFGTIGRWSEWNWDTANSNSGFYNSRTDGWTSVRGVVLGDPAAISLAYGDGPFLVDFAIEDANNHNGASAFGFTGHAKFDAGSYGVQVFGSYVGNSGGTNTNGFGITTTTSGGTTTTTVPINANIGTVVGVSGMFRTSIFEVGGTISSGQVWGAAGPGNGGVGSVFGSAYGKIAFSDTTYMLVGGEHDFTNDQYNPNAAATWAGGGIYYQPFPQMRVGIEGDTVLTNGGLVGGNGNSAFGRGTVGSYIADLTLRVAF